MKSEKSWEGKENSKICFCIGPENCSDKLCRLVKELQERKKGGQKIW